MKKKNVDARLAHSALSFSFFLSGSLPLLNRILCNNIFGAADVPKTFLPRLALRSPTHERHPEGFLSESTRQVHYVATKTTRQVHQTPTITHPPSPPMTRVSLRACLASNPEVSREATGGRSRPDCGSRETKGRLCEGTALAEQSPRAPRTRLPPDDSYLVDPGRACAGGSRAADSSEESKPVALRFSL